MTEDAPFFISRNGSIWACWLDGRPAMKLGVQADVLTAMRQLLEENAAASAAAQPPAGGVSPPQPTAPYPAAAPAPPPQPVPHPASQPTTQSPPPPPLPPPPPAPSAPPPRPEPAAADRAEQARVEPRHDTSILGRVRTAGGSRDVTVLDLSERGCRFLNNFGPMAEQAQVTIKIGPIGPIDATVRWSRGNYVGLEFNSPLYPSVLDHIRQHFDVRR